MKIKSIKSQTLTPDEYLHIPVSHPIDVPQARGCSQGIEAPSHENMATYSSMQPSVIFMNPLKSLDTEFEKKIEVKREEHEQKKDILVTKHELDKDKIMFMHDMTFRDELAKREIFADKEGRLYLGIKTAEGIDKGFKLLVDVKGLKMKAFFSKRDELTDWIYQVSWEAHGNMQMIYIKAENMDPDHLAKTLAKYGVIVKATRRTYKHMVELVYEFLLRHQEVSELPRKLGWNRIGNTWVWTRRGELYLLGVMKHAC